MKRNSKLRNSQSRLKQSRGKSGGGHSGSPAVRYVLLLSLLGVLAWVSGNIAWGHVSALPVFTIRQVTIEGAEHLDKEKIIESAGIRPGENIFRANLTGAAELLREKFTAEDFTVFRKLPDTIVIRVRERKPVALINVGKLVGVDAKGVSLPHIGADMVESLPIITGVQSLAALSDPAVKKRLSAGLQLLDAISRQAPGIQKRISEINVSNASTMGISLIDTGLEVIIGENGWAEKLPNLEKVITQVTGRMDSVRAVDMRFGEKIFLRK
ncbi:MAG: cell division protein FtsQ/DivIB [Candidatus Latescibacterota bacterium]